MLEEQEHSNYYLEYLVESGRASFPSLSTSLVIVF